MDGPSLHEVKHAFESNGLSISDWAAEHGFRRESVYALLAGRSRGRRGEAHRIAVALGLKRPVTPPAVLAPAGKDDSSESESPEGDRL